jgi:3'(2'), 5'-bisphosphate nucleotidase
MTANESPEILDLAPELEVAMRVAHAAGEVVAGAYGGRLGLSWKEPGDPVTEADRRANALIIQRLADRFPADAICAEETPLPDAARAASRGGRCWFVDPLDGTREYIARSGEFCVMIGLAIAGRPVLGVVLAPAWGRTYYGVVGQGACELDGSGTRRPLQVREAESGSPLRAVMSRLHRNPEVDAAVARLGVQQVQLCGSTGLKFMLVASGAVDLYLHTGPGPKLWDGCAPEAIALAAGAHVGDAQGRSLRYDTAHLPLDTGLVVARPALWTRAVAALGGAAIPR